jgi:hypothetical protein
VILSLGAFLAVPLTLTMTRPERRIVEVPV